MSPELAATVMMSNYFHDVATALLGMSGGVMWITLWAFQSLEGQQEAYRYFSRVGSGIKKLARFSLYWIMLGGIPRAIYFRDFEWTNSLEHGQIPVLIVKHLLAMLIVAMGIVCWLNVTPKLKALERKFALNV